MPKRTHDELAEQGEHLAAAVADACLADGRTVAVVESLTSGALASALGRGTGAADWFRGGVVAYQTEIKESVLGVTPGLDPSTPECAAQLARGGIVLFDADVCVSITGVGGPDPSDGHPAGEVHVGTATAAGVETASFAFDGSPQEIVDQSTLAALRAIRNALPSSSD